MAGGRRYYVTVNLENFASAISGDVFSNEGEWYFRVNGARFPSEGFFKLGKNEPLDFGDRKPMLYSAMVNHDNDPFKVIVEVKESDVLHDDTYVHEKFILQWQDSNQVCEAMSKDRKVVLKVRITMTEKPLW